MKAHQAAHSIATVCRVLGVSASGYYAWCAHRPSQRALTDATLLEQITQFHRASRGTALNMAVAQRRPQLVIHHSDQGCQYTAIGFGVRCREAGVRPSMGSVGDCYDNALCESFFATLECELLDRVTLRTRDEARLAVFDFIEGWYNPRRRHSALDYQSPLVFEQQQGPGRTRGVEEDHA